MKKTLVLLSALFLACSPTLQNRKSSPALYEILTQQETGGANINFYEVISDEKELPMLLGDQNLQGKIGKEDIKTSTFVLLNMGEKRTGGFSISVESVREEADKIVIKVKESGPKPGSMVTQALTYPYAVVRVNSKKPIVIE